MLVRSQNEMLVSRVHTLLVAQKSATDDGLDGQYLSYVNFR